MGDALGLHPVAIEDTIEFGQRPKMDSYEHHVLFVFYTVRKGRGEGEELFEPVEVHIYVSGSFVVTVRRAQCTELDALHGELDDADSEAEDYIVYRDLRRPDRRLLSDHRPARGAHRRAGEPDPAAAAQPRAARRDLPAQAAHPRAQPQRGAPARPLHRRRGGRFSTSPASPAGRKRVSPRRRRPPRQIASELHRQQEDLTSLTATYFAANANRLNAVATRLTIGGTFFLAWTLVTGFFGQNFEWLTSNVESRHDFLVYGVGALVVPTLVIGTVFWIKRKDWF